MLEEKKDLSLLDQMKQQHQMYCVQRDQSQINFQQLVGAIFALENMIKCHEEELKKQLAEIAKSTETQGAKEDGQTDEQDQKEAA